MADETYFRRGHSAHAGNLGTVAGKDHPVRLKSAAEAAGPPLEIIFIISSLLKRQPPPNFLPGIKPLRASL
jgi:hypothetical protein